jgi:hypothetical protein
MFPKDSVQELSTSCWVLVPQSTPQSISPLFHTARPSILYPHPTPIGPSIAASKSIWVLPKVCSPKIQCRNSLHRAGFSSRIRHRNLFVPSFRRRDRPFCTPTQPPSNLRMRPRQPFWFHQRYVPQRFSSGIVFILPGSRPASDTAIYQSALSHSATVHFVPPPNPHRTFDRGLENHLGFTKGMFPEYLGQELSSSCRVLVPHPTPQFMRPPLTYNATVHFVDPPNPNRTFDRGPKNLLGFTKGMFPEDPVQELTKNCRVLVRHPTLQFIRPLPVTQRDRPSCNPTQPEVLGGRTS